MDILQVRLKYNFLSVWFAEKEFRLIWKQYFDAKQKQKNSYKRTKYILDVSMLYAGASIVRVLNFFPTARNSRKFITNCKELARVLSNILGINQERK